MPVLLLSDRQISTDRKAFVMGIVNVTDDSFYDSSRGGFELAQKLIDDGADILDIGAESTRPGSFYVDEETQIRKLVPLIHKIRQHSTIPISVDTRKKSVMKACFECGADIFNDISAFEDDEESASFVAEKKIPVILMHKRGIPSQMQKNTSYEDVFREVNEYLIKRAEYALSFGIAAEKIILDPGIGFGKDLSANVQLIEKIGKLGNGRFMILMALSRKTCIAQMICQKEASGIAAEFLPPPSDRLYGTIAANILSIQKGAQIVRVHDVKPMVDTLSVMSYIN